MYFQCLLVPLFTSLLLSVTTDNVDEYLRAYNKKADYLEHNEEIALWDFEVDMSKESRRGMKKWKKKFSNFHEKHRDKAIRLLIESDNLTNKTIRRLCLIKNGFIGNGARFVDGPTSDIVANMTSLYKNTELNVSEKRSYEIAPLSLVSIGLVKLN